MADGRRLFFFGDVTADREVLPDTRGLPHVSQGSAASTWSSAARRRRS
jgi:hypothetical protein